MKQRFSLFIALSVLLKTSLIRAEDEFDPDTGCKLVSTVPDFDIDAFAGKWYIHQQQETENLPIEENYCAVSEYTVLDTPTDLGWTITADNEAQDVDGGVTAGSLCLNQPNDELSKLGIAPCFLPTSFGGPFWIIAFDEEAGSALLSGGQPLIPADPEDPAGSGCRNDGELDSGLYILSRSPSRDEDLIDTLRTIAEDEGFDISVLNDVDHTNCQVCEDSEDDFNLPFVGSVDCDFIGDYPFLGCLFARRKCPLTCGRCE